MTLSRLFPTIAAATLITACMPSGRTEVATIDLDYLTAAQAEGLVRPYLSRNGRVSFSGEAPAALTVRDRRENVRRIRSVISQRDASPRGVSLHFQVVRATEAGPVDPALHKIADALRELLRFEGYELLAQTMVSASERRVVEQNIGVGDMPLHLAVRINDVVGESGVDLQVDLRRAGSGSLLATNVVVPMGQTVVLGSAYPGARGEALILTVRGERGAARLRTTSRRGAAEADIAAEAHAAAAAHAEAMADEAAAHAAVQVHKAKHLEEALLEAQLRSNDEAVRELAHEIERMREVVPDVRAEVRAAGGAAPAKKRGVAPAPARTRAAGTVVPPPGGGR